MARSVLDGIAPVFVFLIEQTMASSRPCGEILFFKVSHWNLLVFWCLDFGIFP